MEKYSKQREEILELVKESYTHPTAEEVYQELKKRNSTSSRGTVYRNLNLLAKNGIIEKISMQVGPDRYDYMRKSHHHAICRQCGNVFDFCFDIDVDELKSSIKSQTDLESISDSIIIEGICKKCKIGN